MFDWNDEELSNIIWGDDGEADDHIVPFQEGSEVYRNKKEWGQDSKNVKPTEQKVRKLESSSNHNSNDGISNSGFGYDAKPESSVPKVAKTELDPTGTDVSNNLAKANELDKAVDIFHDIHESKEQGDFVDYSWADIGSFDDLDRIFSDDDPLFAHGSLGSADDLWSSSKDVANSPLKPFPSSLDSSSLGLDVKTDYDQQDGLQFTVNRGVSDPSSQNLQNACGIVDQYPGGKTQPVVEEQIVLGAHVKSGPNSRHGTGNISVSKGSVDKAYRQKKALKLQKQLEKNCEAKALQDIDGAWSAPGTSLSPFENLLASSMLHSSSSVQQQHLQNPFTAAGLSYGNLTSPYPAMPMVSSVQTVQPAELKSPFLRSSYDVSLGPGITSRKSMDTAARPLTMTPQEKIEKLRRKQQMQAMLAIQRQQQQLSHQVHGADRLLANKSLSQVNNKKLEPDDGAILDDLTGVPHFNSNSPLEQDDAITVTAGADDCSAEYSVLYRLQDVVSKLDINMRLCIRDSLFRLAQSAMQRHHASDTTSTNKTSGDKLEALAKEEVRKSNSYNGIPDVETETNPIDRTVAHLLFHRPLDLSAKHPEEPKSPASLKLPRNWSMNLPMSSTPESSKVKQNSPQQMDHLESSPHMDTSENASNSGAAVIGTAEGLPR